MIGLKEKKLRRELESAVSRPPVFEARNGRGVDTFIKHIGLRVKESGKQEAINPLKVAGFPLSLEAGKYKSCVEYARDCYIASREGRFGGMTEMYREYLAAFERLKVVYIEPLGAYEIYPEDANASAESNESLYKRAAAAIYMASMVSDEILVEKGVVRHVCTPEVTDAFYCKVATSGLGSLKRWLSKVGGSGTVIGGRGQFSILAIDTGRADARCHRAISEMVNAGLLLSGARLLVPEDKTWLI